MSARLAAAALAFLLASAPAPAGAAGPVPDAVADDGAAAQDAPGAAVVPAQEAPGADAAPARDAAVPSVAVPSGSDASGTAIYARFVDGLAQRECGDASPRWRAHYAHVPGQLAAADSEVLPLFGYVVDALRAAHLPTEYALIPFVESGYRPGARGSSGPAGMWQFVAVTARNHDIPIRGGYDGRLSPVDATRAAVRYLKTLHGMFAGDWRLAVMAFNAGEYRVLGALRRHGQRAAAANPEGLHSLSGITRAYVRKLHALSCLMVEAGADEEWMAALDRPVSRLVALDLAGEPSGLDGYAERNGLDPVWLRRLNPAHAGGAGSAPGRKVLVPAGAAAATPPAARMAN
ncbi:MAG: lytic transglycosylase domain-containing protein [Gammaproteobacteria bacterium]|nr:lytic transglycosylase domain-containing protein [Gammaproteobacteria bacterium]